jgi:hypothetical protein
VGKGNGKPGRPKGSKGRGFNPLTVFESSDYVTWHWNCEDCGDPIIEAHPRGALPPTKRTRCCRCLETWWRREAPKRIAPEPKSRGVPNQGV